MSEAVKHIEIGNIKEQQSKSERQVAAVAKDNYYVLLTNRYCFTIYHKDFIIESIML